MRPDPVIEAADISARATGLFLDVRDQAAFENARVEGAVRVPIEHWERAARSAETSLANVEFWETEIGALGIDGGRSLAIYDDGRMTEAARVWFVLQHFGAPARIVNGGWPALRDAFARAQRIASGPSAPTSPLRYTARAGAYRVGLKERDEVKAELGLPTRILDARTTGEFAGDDLRKNARGGHLPGAVNLVHTDLLDGDGRLRSEAALRDLFARVGFEAGDRIITHCDGGGRAALAAIAAVRAGYADVHTYYLSFADWAKDESCPVVRD